jgi:hypothetical protein
MLVIITTVDLGHQLKARAMGQARLGLIDPF